MNLFLPSLLLTTMGSHISLDTVINYWPLVALPILVMITTYFLGVVITRFLNQPAYIIPGIVFNNVTSLPLLLLGAISQSSILVPLLNDHETLSQALVRAKAYVLLHGIVHNLGRFAFGPVMLKSTTTQTIIRKASLIGDESGAGKSLDERTALFSPKYADTNYGASADGSGAASTPVLSPNSTAIAAAEEEFFYKRARQLSRKSIDFDETRALLHRYLPENQEDGSAAADLRPSRRSAANVAALGAITESHDHAEASASAAAPAPNPVPRGDGGVAPDEAPPFAGSDASSTTASSSLDEEPRNFYSILPQPAIDLLESLKPARGSRTHRVWKFVSQFLNPAVVAAIAAIIIGITDSLHWFFFQNTVVATSFTPSITNIGELYPALQLFALGSKLTMTPEIPPRKSTIFWISLLRFIVAPALSIATVLLMINFAPAEFWPRDRMLNFILMIVSVGPPAVTLAAVAEIAGVPRKEVSAISRMLLYMYLVTPLVAPTVAIALSIAYTI